MLRNINVGDKLESWRAEAAQVASVSGVMWTTIQLIQRSTRNVMS